MFCPKCGIQQPDDARFCEGCGADLQAIHEPESPDSQQDAASPGEPLSDPLPPKPLRKKGRLTVVAVVAVIVAAALAVGGFLLSQPPALTDEEILSDFDAEGIAANIVIGSDWANGGSFTVASKTVDSVEDQSQQQSPSYKVAHVTVMCENATFRVISSYDLVYRLQDRTWVQDDALQLTQTVEPVGGVDDAKIVEQAPTFIEMVDEQHAVKDSNGKKQYLKDRYDENVVFEVAENATSASGGSVKLSMSAQKGFAAYNGTLTISFAWNGNDWEVSDCTADEASYKADFSSLVGSWSGTRHDGDATVGQDCMAGTTIPFKLTVKSIDAESMVMTVDMEFVVHKHKRNKNVAESSEGDEVVAVTDALIPVPGNAGERDAVYKSPESDLYKVFLTPNSDQTIEIMLYSSWSFDSHYDYYTLEKAQEA